jgi:uncharacterized membrane protein YdjX (TVP38/TMEM64 family)
MPRWLRVLVVLVLLIAVPLGVSQLTLVRQGFLAVLEHMRGGTAAGVALYVVAYAVGGVMTAPIWLLSGMAGYAYGPVRGILLASPANALAATTAFLLGRFVLAARIERWAAKSPRWGAIHRAVEGDPFRIAVLLRLTPLAPQNLLSYGFALTPMRLRVFAAATWLGLFPITCLHVYMGSLIHEASDLIDGKRPPLGPWGWVLTALGIVVTLGALGFTARLARRALAGVLPAAPSP